MNIKFLETEILPLRAKEIEENAWTAQPIYVVLDIKENFVSGHSEYSPTTNYKGLELEHGYIDRGIDNEEIGFELSDDEMIKPEEITRFYTDNIIAFFLTYKGANDYLKYQSHNLNKGYVYVFHSGYKNNEMDLLLKGE